MPQEHVWKSTETHLRETQIAIKDNQYHLRHLLCSDRPQSYQRYKNLIIYERTMQAYRRHRCRNPRASGVQPEGGSTRHCTIRNLFCSIVKSSKNKGGFVVSISITVQPTLLKAKQERTKTETPHLDTATYWFVGGTTPLDWSNTRQYIYRKSLGTTFWPAKENITRHSTIR